MVLAIFWIALRYGRVPFYASSNILGALKAPGVQAAMDIQKYARLKHTKILKQSFLMERTALNMIEREREDQSGVFTTEDYKCVGCKLFWLCCRSQRLLQDR